MLPVQYVFHFSNKMYQKSLQKRLREFKQAEDHYAIYRYNCAESDLETISKEVAAVYPLINHLYRFKPQEKIQFAVYARKADLQNIMHLDTENTPMGIYWLGQIHLLAPCGVDRGSGGGKKLCFSPARSRGARIYSLCHRLSNPRQLSALAQRGAGAVYRASVGQNAAF